MIKIITLLLASWLSTGCAAKSWGVDDVKFDLEGGSKKEAMIWVSGHSYAYSTIYRELGCINDNESIGSHYLIKTLSKEYPAQTITAEQATAALKRSINHDYSCQPYNK